MAVLGLEHLLADPRFSTNAERVKRRAELRVLIEKVLLREPAAVWIDRLNAAGVPCGPVHGLAEALADPQIEALGMLLDVPHPGHGVVRMTGFPLRLSDTPCAVRRPAPELGQHTAEVLAEFGIARPDPARG